MNHWRIRHGTAMMNLAIHSSQTLHGLEGWYVRPATICRNSLLVTISLTGVIVLSPEDKSIALQYNTIIQYVEIIVRRHRELVG